MYVKELTFDFVLPNFIVVKRISREERKEKIRKVMERTRGGRGHPGCCSSREQMTHPSY